MQSYQIPRLRDAQSASFLSEYEAEVRDALDTIGNAVQVRAQNESSGKFDERPSLPRT